MNKRPIFVFWEVTKACDLSCRHCRAKAIKHPLKGELTLEHGLSLIEQVAEFGEPYPAILFTGGDALKRADLFQLISHARELGIYTAVAASVTGLLDRDAMIRLRELDVGAVSLSLDGADPATHDGIRGVLGTWQKTIEALRLAREVGLKVQVNTTVMNSNISQLADIFHIVRREHAVAWEVFFLVRTGRGSALENPNGESTEDVMHFLSYATGYGVPIRTSEGPQFRRVLKQKHFRGYTPSSVYSNLVSRIRELEGIPQNEVQSHVTSTGDGKGIMFVGYSGEITPSGFLPLNLGKFPQDNIVDVYRHNEMFLRLRDPSNLRGKCGSCEFKNICGGSRSRAYVEFGDLFGPDPICVYQSSGKMGQVTDIRSSSLDVNVSLWP